MNQIKPPPDKEIVEYQLFNNPDSYRDGRNIDTWGNREDIPQFNMINNMFQGHSGGNSGRSLGTVGCSGGSARRVATNNKQMYIQNSLYPGGLSQNINNNTHKSYVNPQPRRQWNATRQGYYSDDR